MFNVNYGYYDYYIIIIHSVSFSNYLLSDMVNYVSCSQFSKKSNRQETRGSKGWSLPPWNIGMSGEKAISRDYSLAHCYSPHCLQNFDCWLPQSRNVNLNFSYVVSQSLSPSIHPTVSVLVQTFISSALNLSIYRSTEGWKLGERQSTLNREEGS